MSESRRRQTPERDLPGTAAVTSAKESRRSRSNSVDNGSTGGTDNAFTPMSKEASLRKGKWTTEEEDYANKIISLFNRGLLPIVAGTTLRSYLSDTLHWYVFPPSFESFIFLLTVFYRFIPSYICT